MTGVCKIQAFAHEFHPTWSLLRVLTNHVFVRFIYKYRDNWIIFMGGEGEVTKKKNTNPKPNQTNKNNKKQTELPAPKFREVIQKISHICMKENNTGYIWFFLTNKGILIIFENSEYYWRGFIEASFFSWIYAVKLNAANLPFTFENNEYQLLHPLIEISEMTLNSSSSPDLINRFRLYLSFSILLFYCLLTIIILWHC